MQAVYHSCGLDDATSGPLMVATKTLQGSWVPVQRPITLLDRSGNGPPDTEGLSGYYTTGEEIILTGSSMSRFYAHVFRVSVLSIPHYTLAIPRREAPRHKENKMPRL